MLPPGPCCKPRQDHRTNGRHRRRLCRDDRHDDDEGYPTVGESCRRRRRRRCPHQWRGTRALVAQHPPLSRSCTCVC